MLKFLIKQPAAPREEPSSPAAANENDDALARIALMKKKKEAKRLQTAEPSQVAEAHSPSASGESDALARIALMKKKKEARRAAQAAGKPIEDDIIEEAAAAAAPAPSPREEPRSKRLKERRSSRLAEDKFGCDEDWGGEAAEEADDSDEEERFIANEEEESEEESEEEAVESEGEAAVSGEEEEAEEEEAPTGLDKIVAERTGADGAVQYRLQFHNGERSWVAADHDLLRSLAGGVALSNYSERKARRAARAQADLAEAIAAGWAVPVERGGQRDEEPEDDEGAEEAAEQCEDAEGEALWVQCDDCGKWRKLPAGCEAPDEDAAWSCPLNPDQSRASCEAE